VKFDGQVHGENVEAFSREGKGPSLEAALLRS
jgi:hypothetical protein